MAHLHEDGLSLTLKAGVMRLGELLEKSFCS